MQYRRCIYSSRVYYNAEWSEWTALQTTDYERREYIFCKIDTKYVEFSTSQSLSLYPCLLV